jgi:flagellar motor switch protein FliN/FliY
VLRFGPVPLAVTYEIGTTFMRIRDLLELAEGSLVVLQRLAGEDLEVRVNGEFLGMGEVTESDGKAAIRMSGRVDEV